MTGPVDTDELRRIAREYAVSQHRTIQEAAADELERLRAEVSYLQDLEFHRTFWFGDSCSCDDRWCLLQGPVPQ